MTNKGEANGRYKDGRQTGNGHRLGWVSLDLWQRMKAQEEAMSMLHYGDTGYALEKSRKAK